MRFPSSSPLQTPFRDVFPAYSAPQSDHIRPQILVCRLSLILIFLIPLEDAVAFPGLGTISRTFGLLVGLTWLSTVLLTGNVRRPSLFHILAFLFALWNTASVLWSADIPLSTVRATSYFQMLGITLLIWDVYTERSMVRAALQAYVLGLFVPTLDILIQYHTHPLLNYQRYAASGNNPNQSAILLSLGVPFACYLLTVARSKSQLLNTLNLLAVPLSMVAILLTGSRMGLPLLAPSVFFAMISLGGIGWRYRLLIGVLILGLLMCLPMLIPDTLQERLGTILDEGRHGDWNGRLLYWKEGLSVAADHPLLGTGAGTFESVTVSGRSAHNTFVALLTELGVIGLFIFAALIGIAYTSIRQLPKWDYIFWLTVLIVWLLANLPMTIGHTKHTWIVLSLLTAASGLPRATGDTYFGGSGQGLTRHAERVIFGDEPRQASS